MPRDGTRVRADLESLGWRVHQLDQCVSYCMMETTWLEFVECMWTISSLRARPMSPDGTRQKQDGMVPEPETGVWQMTFPGPFLIFNLHIGIVTHKTSFHIY